MGNKFSDTTLEINLKAITYNYKLATQAAKTAEVGAVVKADAYGLGIKYVASALYEAGANSFFVATLDEGIQLRKILGEEPRIYIFHGVKKGEEKEFHKNFLIPVLNDVYQVQLWNEFGYKNDIQLPSILHFDTGMNRLGISYYEADSFDADDYQNLRFDYVMSHLASIGNSEDPLNTLQLKRMNHIRKLFPDSLVSLSNSGGVFSDKCYHFDLARPGCSLYGIQGKLDWGLKNVITLKGKIIQIRDVKEDGVVGYNGSAKIKKGSRLAVVPAGYADGILRSLSNNSYATIAGVKVPLLGKVSMDMLIFDVSKVPQNKLKIGLEAELIGKNYTVDEIATNAGTIGYEILTGLGARYKRVYIEN